MNDVYKKLLDGKNLTSNEMYGLMEDIFDGKLSEIQTASILTALKIKGETSQEILGGATFMRDRAVVFENDQDSFDPVGTGGDGIHSINISTGTAFIAAAAGIRVIKHGNRSVSSKSGSADVLQSLGMDLATTKENMQVALEDTGMSFLFAPQYHQSMKVVAGVRKAMGVRTIFNILGPLANPGRANHMLLGVYDKKLMDNMADALIKMGCKRALIVHGMEDGADEISITGKTRVVEVENGRIKEYEIFPENFGLKRASLEDIKGGDPEENKQLLIDALSGKERGAKRDVLLLNAGAALFINGKTENITEGVKLAAKLIDEGIVMETVKSFVERVK
jgi:anthranilate phosphoribosyltransferase